jgi:aspartate aminotransferase-like enzyme
MSVVVTTAVAALSALTGVASFLAYLYFGRRSDLVAAREEALALAETRRQVIHDLRERLKSGEKQRMRAKTDSQRRIRELQAALDRTRAEARKDAYQTQHFYAVALSELANDLLADLERKPPDVDAALIRVRTLLTSQGPTTSQRSTLEN